MVELVLVGWAPNTLPCPPRFPIHPTLTFSALPGAWEPGGSRGPVQVPAVCHWLRDFIVDALRTWFPCEEQHCEEAPTKMWVPGEGTPPLMKV